MIKKNLAPLIACLGSIPTHASGSLPPLAWSDNAHKHASKQAAERRMAPQQLQCCQ
jgi:hypothetical protein